jgi:4-amino-4-deoxy-L-arabinose transferase-like glycosyltransferase
MNNDKSIHHVEKILNTTSLIRPEIDSESWRRFEIALISLGSILFLGISSSYLGVWELGEVTHARLLEWMWTHETWMQVNVPTVGIEARTVSELAVGWWPSLMSMYGLESILAPELRLRLPFFIIGGLCVGALYRFAYDWKGSRLVALSASALLLMTPAFSLGGRHMLSSGGLGGWFFTLSTLSLLNAVHHKEAWGWRVLGWISWVMSAGSLGVIGALCPLIVWYVGLK